MAGLVPAIHVLLVVSSKDVDARHKAGHDVERVSPPLRNHPVSAAFTRPLAFAKSICPAYFAFKTPITLPMSFIPLAPVSAMAAEIAAVTSASDICLGR